MNSRSNSYPSSTFATEIVSGTSKARYRLHYFPESGNSYKLALMLALCGQPWEPVWTDYFGGQTRTPAWRDAVNEMGEVPVLDDGGVLQSQTGPILIQLADRHDQFNGRTEAERYEILRWLFWDNHKLTSYAATYRFLHTFTQEANLDVLAFFRARLDAALAVAELHLQKQPFVVGNLPTAADISMSAYLSYPAEETGYDFSRSHPAIFSWLTRIASIPGWKAPYELLVGPRFKAKP